MSESCLNCKQPFTPGDTTVVSSLGFADPQYCYTCSWQRKLAWQNEYTLYNRKCDATGKSLISQYGEHVPFPVYEREYWQSDAWELPALVYDPNRSFLEQYRELSAIVPRPHNQQVSTENSDYANLVFFSSNCYLSFQIFESDNLLYCYRAVKLRDSMSSFFCSNSELLYECSNVHNSYHVSYSTDSDTCRDSAYLFDCKNVRNSFMCWNLRNKEFCFMNEQLTREQYEQKLAAYNLSDPAVIDHLRSQFKLVAPQFIHKENHNLNTQDSVGDYLVNCQTCQHCYFTDDSERSTNVLRGTQMRDVYDSVVGGLSERCYNVMQPGWLNTAAFTLSCNHSNNIYCSEYVNHSSEVVGCIGLKNGKFCILNTPYSEADYHRLKASILSELYSTAEEFFNPKYSPFAYHESLAQLYFPQPKHEQLPVQTDSHHCATCGKAFKVTETEQALTQQLGVALPADCFHCRIKRLTEAYSTVQLQPTRCGLCDIQIQVAFNPQHKTVYCNSCYTKELL